MKRKPAPKGLLHLLTFVKTVFALLCAAAIFFAGRIYWIAEVENREAVATYFEILETYTYFNQETNVLTVDWEGLRERNENIIAWVRFPSPDIINYPIVQGPDNYYYLNRTVDGEWNSSGSIFLSSYNSSDFTDFNSIIYGHRMNNGTMFTGLENFFDQGFVDENPYFYIYFPNGIRKTYQVFAISHIPDASDPYETTVVATERMAYFEMMQELSMITSNAPLTSLSKIVSLSTCTAASNHMRTLLQGVEIREEVVRVDNWYIDDSDDIDE